MRWAVIALVLLAGLVYALDPNQQPQPINSGGGLEDTLEGICTTIKTLVPLVALVMMMIGGVVYGAGQILGAEMRSRAVVWATSLFMGGIIGLVIAVAAPWLIKVVVGLYPSSGISTDLNC